MKVADEADGERDEDADEDVEEGVRVDVVGEGAEKEEIRETEVTPTDVVRQVEQVNQDPDCDAHKAGVARGVDYIIVAPVANVDEPKDLNHALSTFGKVTCWCRRYTV